MVKAEFVRLLVEESGCDKKNVEAVLSAFDKVMLEEVFAKEDSVRLGVGTFSGYTKVTNDRKGRNPLTGEELEIKGKTVKGYPKFKPSKAAKE